MEEIRLVKPSIEYGEDIMQFRKEIMEANDNDSFAGCGSLEKSSTAEYWLNLLAEKESVDTCPAGSVTSNTYIAVRISDNKIVGVIDLRHHIDHPILGSWGGHMGYSIRPGERNKGYAKEILRLNLQHCKDRNMVRVMITCSVDNIASEKTIIANGGVFEKQIYVDGEYIKRYWITL
ncbi:putative acetyltransferase [Natranaerovirga hydrolytica]|uniref:Putative acetyltransferase n=1 Tax=Natranaerovirga hydrolytica TaxID=680378 RepID=A0A4R1MJI6_9FIRM|nr:GNAT family N-acetyltransferase [Natranaerovirga hydrolytica]TCK92657.1 putative acetyltransferase [Natranaerovirga hydrolytica]